MATGLQKTKVITPIPPDKGSFPLDHEGECKDAMVKYLVCLKNHKSENTACREESQHYLRCRMDNQLMAQEDWSRLGFKASELSPGNAAATSSPRPNVS